MKNELNHNDLLVLLHGALVKIHTLLYLNNINTIINVSKFNNINCLECNNIPVTKDIYKNLSTIHNSFALLFVKNKALYIIKCPTKTK